MMLSKSMIFLVSSFATLLVVVNAQTPCVVCGEGKVVTNPDVIWAIPGQPAVACGVLEGVGSQGLIPDNLCGLIPNLIATDCGCAEEAVPDEVTTDAPVPPPDASPNNDNVPTSPVISSPTLKPIQAAADNDNIFNTNGSSTTSSAAPVTAAPAMIETPTPAPTPTREGSLIDDNDEKWNERITSLFDNIPRFMDKSDDLLALFSSNKPEEDVADYITGLLTITIVVVVLTMVWLLSLGIIASCCCSKRKCFKGNILAGYRFNTKKQSKFTIVGTRFIFVVTTLCFMTSVFFAVEKGTDNFRGTVQTLVIANNRISQLTISSQPITDDIFLVGDEAEQIRDVLVNDYLDDDNFCPALPNDQLEELLGFDIETSKDQLVDYLTLLTDFTKGNTESISSGLTDLRRATENIDTVLGDLSNDTNWIKHVIYVFWLLNPIVLLLGGVLPSIVVGGNRRGNAILTFVHTIIRWIFVPLLIIQIILSAISASILSIGAIANTDFCAPSDTSVVLSNAVNTTFLEGSDGPQLTLLYVAEALGFDNKSLPILQYYLSDCRVENFLEDFVLHQQTLYPQAEAGIDEFLSTLEGIGTDTIEQACFPADADNAESVTALTSLLESMTTILTKVVSISTELIDILKCQSISPIINDTLNDGMCYYTLNALTWSVVSFGVILLSGLIMLTLRSSLYPNEETNTTVEDFVEDKYGNNPNNYETDEVGNVQIY